MEILDEIATDAGTFRVSLRQDEDAFDPRKEYDTASVIVSPDVREGDHPRQIMELIDEYYQTFDEVAQWVRDNTGATVVLPLRSRHEGGFELGDPEDSRSLHFIGVVYDDAKVTASERALSPTWDPRAAIESEIEEYNSWASGDVWGHVVEKLIPACEHCGCAPRWEVEESVWGFYGYEYAEKEARDVLSAVAGAA